MAVQNHTYTYNQFEENSIYKSLLIDYWLYAKNKKDNKTIYHPAVHDS